MTTEAMKLWDACHDGDVDARERLLAQHLPLVHHVARKLMRTLGTDVDADDLVSAGTMGLMQAVETFDASRGLAFSTFAAPRIRGAILDDLRRWDHAPRSVRRKQRAIARAKEALSAQLGRAPTAAELAAGLDVDIDTVHAWQASAEVSVLVPLDRPVSADDPAAGAPADYLEGMTADDVEGVVAEKEERAILRRHIGQLRERERVVLALYYHKELKLHEIAQVLGLTESRISQIRTKALATLRERMTRERQGYA